MTKSEKQLATEALTIALCDRIQKYNECLKNDGIFEVRKELRLQIKQILIEIQEINERSSPSI